MSWAALLAVLAFAPPVTVQDGLAECDRVALTLPAPERDYECYVRLAQDGHADEVLAHMERAVQLHPDDGRLWLALGATQGDFARDSAEALRTAITTLAAQGLPQYQIQAQLNLARRLSNRGEEARARQRLADARRVAEELRHPLLSAIVEFDTLGMTARSLDGDLLDQYERAQAAYDALPDSSPYPVRRSGLMTMARAARALGRTRIAAELAHTAAVLAEDAGDHHSALHAHKSAARNRLRAGLLGNDPDAIPGFRRRLQELLARAIELDNPRAELNIRVDLAYTAPPPAQAEAWSECLALAKKLDLPRGATACRGGLVEAIAATQPNRAATIADELVEEALADGRHRSIADAYRWRGQVAATAGDIDTAWTAWRHGLDAFEKLSRSAERAQLRELLQAGGAERYRLAAGTMLEFAADSSQAFARAFEAMERMRGREAAEFRRRGGLDAPPPVPRATLSELQAAIPMDTVLLEFQIESDVDVAQHRLGGSWLLLVTRDRVRAHRLPGAPQLNPAIAMVADGLAGPPSPSVDQASEVLHEQLLGDALAELGPEVNRLVLVLDGQLHRLPFAALRSDGEPLAGRFAISIAPSATMWLHVREGSALPRTLLAFADPSPPSPSGAGRWDEQTRWRALPGAVAEARLAAETLGGDSVVLTGDAASEDALRAARPGGVLHIAAHAIVDHTRPAASRVILAETGTGDGHVDLDELSRLDQTGALVVLAACQGADGEVLAGEGALSPARAFFLAGARTVVAGLWPVRDVEAAAFFAEFYRALDRGESVDAAVATAQTSRRHAGAPPSAWAGFVVYGDGALRLAPRAPRRRGWIPIAAVLVLAAGWLGLRARPR
ncbi:MAG: CHAT domain-containing protein [Myxococcota bacterium]